MPRPSWVDDLDCLDAIETALAPDERAMLHAQLDRLGVDRDGWLEIPALRQSFAMFALSNLTSSLLTADELSHEEARARAAHRLRIPEKTLETWERRWVEAVSK